MLYPYVIVAKNSSGEEKTYTELFLNTIPIEEKISIAKSMFEKDGWKIVNHSF